MAFRWRGVSALGSSLIDTSGLLQGDVVQELSRKEECGRFWRLIVPP